MENLADRKKFILKEIAKGNLKTAYEISKETASLKLKEITKK